MPEKWTGDLIGQMHLAGVTRKELAKEAGYHEKYLLAILNGHSCPKGAEEKITAAFQRIVEDRKSA